MITLSIYPQSKLKHVTTGTPSTSSASSSQSMPSSSMSSLTSAASSVIAAAGAGAVTKAEQLVSVKLISMQYFELFSLLYPYKGSMPASSLCVSTKAAK